MIESRGIVEDHILDLLVDGPSSFSALYDALVRHYGYSRSHDVIPVAVALQRLADRGLIELRLISDDGTDHAPNAEELKDAQNSYAGWLPTASSETCKVDEIALWSRITDRGREVWEAWARAAGEMRTRRWALNDLADRQTILILAENNMAAEEALSSWLGRRPTIEILEGSRHAVPVSDSRLDQEYGFRIGVRVTCSYRDRPNKI